MSPLGTFDPAPLVASFRAAHGDSLRILHVASGDLWAGAEAMLKSLAEAQGRLSGVTVTVVLFNEGRLAEELRRAVHDVIVLPERSLSTPRLLIRLARTLKRVAPDVLHTHRIKEDIVAGMANRLASHACCVRTAHGVDEGVSGRSRLRGRILETVHSLCVRHLFDSTFVVSAELHKRMVARFPGSRVTFVPNGINVEELCLHRQRRGARGVSSPVHVGIVGRLVPIKRVDVFLRTAATLCQAHPGAFRFTVFGEGPERSGLEALAESLRLGNAVNFPGYKADIAAELAALDMLFLTSDSEGLPMVILEAMAAGVPVVSHAVGQIPDVLEEGLCGTLVAQQEPQAYAAAAAEFLSDSEPFATRAARAAVRVATHFSAEACARSYIAQYRILLESRRVSRS